MQNIIVIAATFALRNSLLPSTQGLLLMIEGLLLIRPASLSCPLSLSPLCEGVVQS
jgi:hypothetical protein